MKNKYKILIVSDKEESLSAIVKQLEQEKYDVETVRSTADALEKVKSSKRHIVLSQIEMPQMDGIELLREIKKYDPMAQVIMMTDSSTMDKVLSSLEFGANDYISKPFVNMEQVLNAIDDSVQKLERWKTAIRNLVE